MKPVPVMIKKYGNRRLYDTVSSRYINLEDIAALIRAGKDVQVVDARTNQDLTRVTLTQIITEDAKGQPTGLPLELLRQLIVASDHAGREFIMWYLKSAFDAYQKVQNAMQSRLSEMHEAVLSPVQTVRRFLGMTASEESQAETEVDALRRRVAELEARLAAQTAAPVGTRHRTSENPVRTPRVPVQPPQSPAKPRSDAKRRHAGNRGRSKGNSPDVRRPQSESL